MPRWRTLVADPAAARLPARPAGYIPPRPPAVPRPSPGRRHRARAARRATIRPDPSAAPGAPARHSVAPADAATTRRQPPAQAAAPRAGSTTRSSTRRGAKPSLSARASRCRSAAPYPCIAEHAHPWRILAPFFRMPAQLHAAEHALGMRHHDRHATVGGGEAGQAAGRAVGVEREVLGRLAAVVDEAHSRVRLRRAAYLREADPAFAVGHRHRYPRTGH